jgi:hypothetical protein
MAACASAFVNNAKTDGVWYYSSVGGSMPLLPSAMPAQAAVWANLAAIRPCQALHFFTASHSCSYSSLFSKFAGDKNNSCLPWDTALAPGVGTYCGSALAQLPKTAAVGDQLVPYPFPLGY